MAKVRVILCKNIGPGEQKTELISTKSSREELLDICSRQFGVIAMIVYNEKGEIIKSVKELRDGAILYVSQGEPFHRRVLEKSTMMKKYTLAMLGTAVVGKSAITHRYVSNKFIPDYDPTIEDYYSKTSMVNSESIQVSILDTAGMEDYYPLVDDWIDKKNAFVLVFAVDIPDSLRKLKFFHDKIKQRYDDAQKKPLVVIAANKIDLPHRSVTIAQGQAFADELGVKYFEVSAASNANIDEMFTHILSSLRQLERGAVKKKKKRCFLL